MDGVCGFTAAGAAACIGIGPTRGLTLVGCTSDGPCGALDGDRAYGTAGDIGCRIVDGDASCAGDNLYGVVTPGTPAAGAVAETRVRANVADIGVGTHHVCALGSDGGVRCWGHALFGATGFASGDDPGPTFPCVGGAARCQAIEVVPLPPTMGSVVQLSTRQTLSCARSVSGEVACWGTLGRGDEGIAPTRFQLAP